MKRWRSAAARRICEFAGAKSVEGAVIEIGRRLTEGQAFPPTDLDSVLSRVDIESCRVDRDLMIAGELRKTDSGFEIVYAEKQPKPRQRFTICHEIGHAVLERTGPHCPRHGRELEEICDLIASEILIPQAALLTHAKKPLCLSEIRRLAKLFETSITAMAIRCAAHFGFAIFQTDAEELSWIVGDRQWGIQSPKSQCRGLAQIMKADDRKTMDFDLTLLGGARKPCVLETVATGEDRQLFILTRKEC